MGLVAHDDDVMIRLDRRQVIAIEFLNQRENVAGVALQHIHQTCGTGGNKGIGCDTAEAAAVFKGIADLVVQFIPVGQHHNGRTAGEFATNLLGQEHHGIALAAALRMPENTQSTIAQLAVTVRFHGLVHAEILMIAGHNLRRMTAGMIEEDKVFQQVKEILLFADTAQHGFQADRALIILFQSLPLVEEFILAAEGADPGIHTVGEHHKGIEPEQLGHRVLIVPVVAVIGLTHIHAHLFQLDEKQRDAVHKANDVCPAVIQRALHHQLLHGEKVVIGGVIKINDTSQTLFDAAIRQAKVHRHAVRDEAILGLVGLQGRGGGGCLQQGSDDAIRVPIRHPAVQAEKCRAQVPGEQHLVVVGAA